MTAVVASNSRPPGRSEAASATQQSSHWERSRRRRRMGLGMLAVIVVVVVVVLGLLDSSSSGSEAWKVVDSQHALSSYVRSRRRRRRELPRLERRHLDGQTADKYHPDKDDVSCERYFANETGEDPPWNGNNRNDDRFKGGGEDRDGYYGGDYGEYERPPPCREPSSEDDSDSDNGATVTVTTPAPVTVATPAPIVEDNVTPIPTLSPTLSPTPEPATPSPTPETEAEAAFTVSLVPPQPTPSPTSTPSPISEPIPQPTLSTSSTTHTTDAPAPHTYYTPAYAEVPDESLLQNIARVAISIAAPPAFRKGVSHKEVYKAITKLLNVTSAMRSEELMEEFLELYAPNSGAAALARQILNHYPVDEIPHIIPSEQTLFFHLKYTNTFHRQQPDKAFFWELVAKPAKSIPIERIEVERNGTATILNASPPTLPPSNNNNNSNTTTTDHSTNVRSADLQLAKWWLHPIYYRCYMRDQEGTLIPIEDLATLQLIEEQMYEWVNFHVDFSNELLSKLEGRAVGVAMPGDEFDLYLVDGDWIPEPYEQRPHSGSGHHTSTTNSRESPSKEDDFFVTDPPVYQQGTFSEPLIGGREGISSTTVLLETPQELMGLVVLCSTIAGAVLWCLASTLHRRRQMEQEVWGANMGTEHALQELLNVGWKVQDQHEAGQEPRQILVIYDKTEHGMGYREDDSMLMGGCNPPMFPGLTD